MSIDRGLVSLWSTTEYLEDPQSKGMPQDNDSTTEYIGYSKYPKLKITGTVVLLGLGNCV